jgi:hypothetical protein
MLHGHFDGAARQEQRQMRMSLGSGQVAHECVDHEALVETN